MAGVERQWLRPEIEANVAAEAVTEAGCGHRLLGCAANVHARRRARRGDW